MLLALDTLLVAAAGLLLPSIAFWSGYRQAVNRAQRRLYRRAYGVAAVALGLLCAIAWGSAQGAVPLWLAVSAIALWCALLVPALSWLRRELAVRAREPYADMFR